MRYSFLDYIFDTQSLWLCLLPFVAITLGIVLPLALLETGVRFILNKDYSSLPVSTFVLTKLLSIFDMGDKNNGE
jgi:hypothetical protein